MNAALGKRVMTSKPIRSRQKRERVLDVAHVQVHVPHAQVGRDASAGGSVALDHRHQAVHVERHRPAQRGRVAEVAPVLARAVGGQLDAVAVGVGQVDRLGDLVVGRAADRRARWRSAAAPRGPARAATGAAARSGRARRGGPAGRAPGSSVSTSRSSPARAERRLGPVAARQLQADRGLVERDRAVEVGHREVDRAEPQVVGERGPWAVEAEVLVIHQDSRADLCDQHLT